MAKSFFSRLFGRKSSDNSSNSGGTSNSGSSNAGNAAVQDQTMCVKGKRYKAVLQGGRWVTVGEPIGDCEEPTV